jgi:hypothetical protein
LPQETGAFTTAELQVLRENRVIEQTEIVYQYGDLYVAENVVTLQRRQLSPTSVRSVINEGRRVLHG